MGREAGQEMRRPRFTLTRGSHSHTLHSGGNIWALTRVSHQVAEPCPVLGQVVHQEGATLCRLHLCPCPPRSRGPQSHCRMSEPLSAWTPADVTPSWQT